MGRGLRPLSPDSGPVERFACELRALRALAGDLPFWKMARRCSVAKSALAAAAAGRRLPSERVTREFVSACGGDWGYWRDRWEQAAAEVAQSRDTPSKELVEWRPGVVDVLAGRLPVRISGAVRAEDAEPAPAEVRVPRGGRRWRSIAAVAASAALIVAAGVSWRAGLFDRPDPADHALQRAKDGTDPQIVGCGADVRTLATVPIRLPGPLILRGRRLAKGTQVGTVALRYSARCAGAWARFDPAPVIDTELEDSTAGVITVWARRPADTTQETWKMGHIDNSYSGILLTGLGCVIAGARIDIINENVSVLGETACLPVLADTGPRAR